MNNNLKKNFNMFFNWIFIKLDITFFKIKNIISIKVVLNKKLSLISFY